MGFTTLVELLKNAAPRITVATLSRPRSRQLKPFASPGLRLGLFDGGVEFGESDMMAGNNWKKATRTSVPRWLLVVQA